MKEIYITNQGEDDVIKICADNLIFTKDKQQLRNKPKIRYRKNKKEQSFRLENKTK